MRRICGGGSVREFKFVMRRVALGALISISLTGQAAARPDLLQFNGMIRPDLQTCVATLQAACEDQFNTCTAEPTAVFHSDDTVNVALLCTAAPAIGGAIFSVAAAAEKGHGDRLRAILVRMKEFIDNRF